MMWRGWPFDTSWCGMAVQLPPLPRRPFRKERLHMRIYRVRPEKHLCHASLTRHATAGGCGGTSASQSTEPGIPYSVIAGVK